MIIHTWKHLIAFYGSKNARYVNAPLKALFFRSISNYTISRLKIAIGVGAAIAIFRIWQKSSSYPTLTIPKCSLRQGFAFSTTFHFVPTPSGWLPLRFLGYERCRLRKTSGLYLSKKQGRFLCFSVSPNCHPSNHPFWFLPYHLLIT